MWPSQTSDFVCFLSQVLSGPHYYSWGDHGGILMAVTQGSETNQLKYSTNEGETWKTFKFSEKPVFVYGLLTEPGEKSTIFTIFGSYKENGHSWLILQINTTDVLGVPCTENDYKLWSPSDERGNECLLGHKTVFKRRTPHATCFNGEDFDRPFLVSNCSCTREDYECYRKISGDTCSGGDVEARLEGETVPCPLAEENEFILYATRYSIHRYDLSSGLTEDLPLTGLRGAVALDFDYSHNCLYWADVTLEIIQRLCLNGSSGQEVIIGTGLETVEALVFEPISQLLYWVNAGIPKIEVANPDGDLRLTILNSSVLERPRALTLVPKEGLMFWTDWGDSRPGIYRSEMDGSSASCIVSEGVKWPNGISADDRWIYWTEAYMDRIERVDFNGRQRSVILDSLPHPYAIAVFKNDIYWNDWSQLSIFRASKHNGARMETLVDHLNSVMDMKIFYHGKSAENTCLSNQYRCSNGNCINNIWKCDNDNDCGDMSDEKNCPTTVCDPDTQFRCHESGTCVPLSYKCDLEDDCGDSSDESHCEAHQCQNDEFSCNSGMCIRLSWKCDGDNDCRDWSDEANCTEKKCNGFQCSTGVCIPSSKRCNGAQDCSDGSDEQHCESLCTRYMDFMCKNRQQCLLRSMVCDGTVHCRDGSDEDPAYAGCCK
ncbi:hypothetical protein Chor_005651 [Crotalus horridus]